MFKADLERIYKRLGPRFILLCIVAFALIIRFSHYIGLNLNDDLVYVNIAHDMISGKWVPSDYIFNVRHTMNEPIALMFLIFGVSNFSAGFYPLLTSIGCVLAAYYIGKKLFNDKVGLLAAFFMAIYPINVAYATTVVPDVPEAFFEALSVLCFVLGEKRKQGHLPLYFLSGVAIGLAWLIKGLGLLIIPVYGVMFLYEKLTKTSMSVRTGKSKDRELLWVRLPYFLLLAGLVCVIVVEGLYYQATLHDFLLRWKTEMGHYTPELLGVNRDLNYYPQMLMGRINPTYAYFGLFFYFTLIAIAFTLVRRRPEAIFLTIWFSFVLLYLQFGVMNIKDPTLIQRIHRFLNIIAVPSALLIAYFLVENPIDGKKAKRFFGFAAIMLLLATSIYSINAISYDMINSMADYNAIANYMKANSDGRPIYGDYDCIWKINFLMGYEKTSQLRDLSYVKSPDELKGAYVILNCSRGFVEVKSIGDTLPQWLVSESANWTFIKRITDAQTGYYANYDPVIYFVNG